VLFPAVLPFTITVFNILLKGFNIGLRVKSFIFKFKELFTFNFWFTKA
jgi:hypothetical protein